MLLLKYAIDGTFDFPQIDLEKGDSFIYEIMYWNQTLATELGDHSIEDLLGNNAEVGAKRCYSMTLVDKKTNLESQYDYNDCCGWKIVYDIWDWTTNQEDFNESTYFNGELIVYEQGLDNGEDIDYLSGDIFGIVSNPPEAYLSGIIWGQDTNQEGKYVNYEIQTDHDYHFIYNDQGVRKLWNCTYAGETLFSIELVDTFLRKINDDSTDENEDEDRDVAFDSIGFGPWQSLFVACIVSVILLKTYIYSKENKRI